RNHKMTTGAPGGARERLCLFGLVSTYRDTVRHLLERRVLGKLAGIGRLFVDLDTLFQRNDYFRRGRWTELVETTEGSKMNCIILDRRKPLKESIAGLSIA